MGKKAEVLKVGILRSVFTKFLNSSIPGILLKFCATHWLAISLVLFALSGYTYGKLQYERALRATIQLELAELQDQLNELKLERDELFKRLKEYEELGKINEELIAKLREQVSKLSNPEKRKLLLSYIDRLKQRRGLK